MAELASGRVDPRALLRSLKVRDTEAVAAPGAAGLGRVGVIALGAVVSLAAFGTFVVRANDDAGALAFIRSQAKPRPAAVDYGAPRAAYPVSFYAPRAFFPQAAAPTVRRAQQAPTPSAQNQRNSPIVASYAPFGGFFPTDSGASDSRRQRSQVKITTPSVSKPTLAAPFPNVGAVSRGGRVTYCVRSCDGFFFPLSSSTGSDRADEAACNRLCPTAETKLYVGQIGADVDDARSRQNGRRYAQMANAFSYRTTFSTSCSCNASGTGLTTDGSVYRDQTLKIGDVVMTNKGMRVFTGGQFPYRPSNFSSIEGSGRYAGKAGETLRVLEQASLPGRSGVTQRQPRRKTDEVADLRRAAEALRTPDQVVRYVGPDRSALNR